MLQWVSRNKKVDLGSFNFDRKKYSFRQLNYLPMHPKDPNHTLSPNIASIPGHLMYKDKHS